MSADEQLSMFSVVEEMQLRRTVLPQDYPEVSQEVLLQWKQDILDHQQQVRMAPPPQQGALFDFGFTETSFEIDPDTLDPFSLRQQNTEFWRWKYTDAGSAALYFVIDYELPILLYVGETVKANQRWKGEHDCKRYLDQYVATHRRYKLPVSVGIGFQSGAPEDTRQRQKLESTLIYKWRSPFNKENWGFWKTPFVGGKLKT